MKTLKMKEYRFNWIDENGNYTGFNSVWAKTRRGAITAARKKERPAGPMSYTVRNQAGEIVQMTSRFAGMYVDVQSVKVMTREQGMELNRMGNMLSM